MRLTDHLISYKVQRAKLGKDQWEKEDNSENQLPDMITAIQLSHAQQCLHLSDSETYHEQMGPIPSSNGSLDIALSIAHTKGVEKSMQMPTGPRWFPISSPILLRRRSISVRIDRALSRLPFQLDIGAIEALKSGNQWRNIQACVNPFDWLSSHSYMNSTHQSQFY